MIDMQVAARGHSGRPATDTEKRFAVKNVFIWFAAEVLPVTDIPVKLSRTAVSELYEQS